MSYRARILDYIDDLNYMSKDRVDFPLGGGEFIITINDSIKNVNGVDDNCSQIQVYYKKGDVNERIYNTVEIHRIGDWRHIYYDILQLGLEKLKTKT